MKISNCVLRCVGLVLFTMVVAVGSSAMASLQVEALGGGYVFDPAAGGGLLVNGATSVGTLNIDGSNPQLLPTGTTFVFDATGMAPSGQSVASVTYSGAGTFSVADISDIFNPVIYLAGTIDTLSLDALPTPTGFSNPLAFIGAGSITVTGGLLKDSFSNIGAGATYQVGVRGTGVVDFTKLHTGIVDTTLVGLDSSGTNPVVPEPASLLTWVGLVLAGVVGRGRRGGRS